MSQNLPSTGSGDFFSVLPEKRKVYYNDRVNRPDIFLMRADRASVVSHFCRFFSAFRGVFDAVLRFILSNMRKPQE